MRRDNILSFIEESKAYPYVLFGVMAVGVMILFSDFIFSDLMLSGSDTINAGIFFREMLVQHVHTQGSIPKWNPYIFGGMPYIDAFHGDIFYPLSSLKYFGSIFRMLGWVLVLHIYLSGIFMYFASREFGLSRLASSVAALGYMFSGYLVSLVAPGHDGKIFVTTLFPLTVLFLARAFKSRALFNFTMLGIVIGVIILSPHPQMSYFTLLALGFYTVYLMYQKYKKDKAIVRTGMLGLGAALAVMIGLGISAIQFYPGYKYTKEFSPRADTKSGWDWATSWSLHEEDVVGQLVPEFSGTRVNNDKYPDVIYWGKNAFKDNSEYAGVIVLFLAVIGAFFYRKQGIFFAGLALFALSYALAGTTPIFKLYYYVIPNVKSMRAASMIMFLFCFSLSLLAAMGVQWLVDSYSQASAVTKKRFKIYMYSFVGALGALALLWNMSGEGMLSAYGGMFYDGLKTQVIGQGGITKWRIAMANLPSIQAGFWISFFFVALTAGVIWAVINHKAPVWALLLIPILVMTDGVRWGKRFVETVDAQQFRRLFDPNVITQFLNDQPGTFRTMTWGIFNGDYLPFHDIELVDGYHGNQLRWYDELLGGPAQVPNRILGGAALTNITNARFMNLAGTRFFVVPKQSQFPPQYFGDEPLRTVKDFGSVVIIENPNYFPRAFFVDSLVVIPDPKQITEEILRGQTDLSQVGLVESLPSGWSQANAVDTLGNDSAWIRQEGMDSISVNYSCDDPKVMIVTTAYYPGWKPFVNGQEAEVFMVDRAFMGVVIPPGSGEVVFRFDSPLYDTGKTITFASLAVSLVLLGLGWVRRRNPDAQ